MRHRSRIRPPWLAWLVALAVVLATASLLAVTSAPAHADHQTCTGDYPTGTVPIGYPDLAASKDIGWNGQVAQNSIDSRVFEATAVKESLLNGAAVATAVAEIIHEKYDNALEHLDGPPEWVAAFLLKIAEIITRIVAIGLTTGAVLAAITETVFMTMQLDISTKIAGENACGSVLAGDMVDTLWVTTVQRNLASDGPPLAMLLTPTDHEEPGGTDPPWPLQPQHEEEDFAWCPEIDLPEVLPAPAGETDLNEPNGAKTGGNCVPGYLDGALTSPYDGAPRITVQTIVRDAIDHAKAHSLPVRDAEQYYAAAVTAVGNGRYKEAFQRFRRAYQAAAGFDG